MYTYLHLKICTTYNLESLATLELNLNEVKTRGWGLGLSAHNVILKIYFDFNCNVCCVAVFSLCEYVVILSNLGYHATSYYDYYHVTINLSSLL